MNSRSTPRRPFLAAFVAIAVVIAIGAILLVRHHKTEAHANHHGAHEESVLTLNNGQPWATDEPLRLGMQRIRDAVSRQGDDGHAGALSTAEATALANVVKQEVTFLLQNCRLAPSADANLHIIINELMSGAGLLSAGRSREGLDRLRHALDQYPRYFDHPHWSPLPGLAS
jgi:hypothetical protein